MGKTYRKNPDPAVYRGWRDERFAQMPARERARLYAQLVWERDQGLCGICGEAVPLGLTMQVDHVVPLSAGGLDTPDNVRASHARCNMTRSCDGPKAAHTRLAGKGANRHWVAIRPAGSHEVKPLRLEDATPLTLWADVPEDERDDNRRQQRAKYLQHLPQCAAAVKSYPSGWVRCYFSASPDSLLCGTHLRKLAYDAETLERRLAANP